MFTPGPWKADEPRFGYQTIRQDPADWDGHGYQLICTVPQSTKGSHYGEMFKANARLIAAAPELLAALRACVAVACDEYTEEPWKAIDLARSAIRKATEPRP